MQHKDKPVVFMGTPELASYSLEKLIEKQFNIAAVVTSPDKPAGRGKKLNISAVKKLALENDLKVLQPQNLDDDSFIDELKRISPVIQVVVAFRKLPSRVWKVPSLGTFNMHASLLPDYRGAAPINRVIMNGEKQTGVTTFLIDDKIDTGKILLKEKIDIDPGDTAGTLHDKIKVKGADIVIETLEGLLNNNLKPVDQKELEKEYTNLKQAPKIFKEDCRINWNRPCNEIVNLIRGLNPIPGAFTEIALTGGNEPVYIKIFRADYEKTSHEHNPGTIISDNKTYLKIATPDGFVCIEELQVAGKKRIETKEFLRGYNVTNRG